jgi:xanthine dehydrogenase accessory factor
VRGDVLKIASELADRGEAFALATVVRREPPSSAQVGDVAIVTREGVAHGWVGGSCTQPTVMREVLDALADDTPRLITLSRSAEPHRDSNGAVVRMTCHSGGSVEIYVDPVLPAPRLLVFGTSPIARALARLGKVMGYGVDVVDPSGGPEAILGADRTIAATDVARLHPSHAARTRRLCAVVATMGQHSEAGDSTRERVESATDPVCGMSVRVTDAGPCAEFEGRTYHFCSAGCRARFVSEPERYAVHLVALSTLGAGMPSARG